MEICCPHCSESYDVPKNVLPKSDNGDQQNMRCYRCGEVFTVVFSTKKPAPGKKIHFFRSVMIGAVVGLLIFSLFVAYRNNWAITFSELDHHIFVAFTGESRTMAPPLEQIQVQIDIGYKLSKIDGETLLVVNGHVKNNSQAKLAKVNLQGRLVTKDGITLFETHSPCGRVFKDKKLRSTHNGKFTKLFKHKGRNYNCRIKSNSKRKFQLIFESIPADFNEPYEIRVEPLSAQYAKAKLKRSSN